MSKLMNSMVRRLLAYMLLSFLMAEANATEQGGGISLNRTRVVFLSTDTTQSIAINNQGQRTYLVKSIVTTTPEGQEGAPFIVTPPLFRLEANSQNSLRILHQNTQELPTDRESVFYLSTIMVPSSQKPEASNAESMSARVSVGLQNIIKLFYRPTELSMTPEQAEKALIFTQQGKQVLVNNPTPYYQTFAQLTLDGVSVNVRNSISMIPPFSQVSYPIKGTVRQATWSVINDYGGSSQSYQAVVQNGGAT